MTFRNPSYITRTAFGVYYFQARIPKAYAEKLALKSSLIRKSLRTKNRRLALSIASRIWSRFYILVYLDKPMEQNKSGKQQLQDLISKQDVLADDWERARVIKLAMRVTSEFNEIESWDSHGRDMFWCNPPNN